MLLIFDLDKKRLVQSVGVDVALTTIEAKRGSGEEVSIQLVKAGQVFEMDEENELRFVAKKSGEYDSDPLVSTQDFEWDELSQQYRAEISYITTPLNALFAVDGNPANDVPQIIIALEVGWRPNNSSSWRRSENDVELILRNNYLRDDDGAPDTEEPESETWLRDRAVRHDESQSLTDAAADQARQNIKMVYDATKGGFIVTLADGSDVFLVVAEVPA